MRTCLLQITGYRQLYHDVENVRKKPYDSANAQHEKLLLKVRLPRFRERASAVRAAHSSGSFSWKRLLVSNSYLISIFKNTGALGLKAWTHRPRSLCLSNLLVETWLSFSSTEAVKCMSVCSGLCLFWDQPSMSWQILPW